MMVVAQAGLVGSVVWMILGILLGIGILLGLAGRNEQLSQFLLRYIFNQHEEGWSLVQRGNRYTINKLNRNEDTESWYIGEEEDAEWLEDPADQMHNLFGVPFALKLGSKRPVTDIETAAAMSEAAAMETDGGDDLVRQYEEDDDGNVRVVEESELTLSEIQDRLTVGSLRVRDRVIQYVNPYTAVDPGKVYDIRNIVQAFKYDSASDTPRKAAKNATETPPGATVAAEQPARRPGRTRVPRRGHALLGTNQAVCPPGEHRTRVARDRSRVHPDGRGHACECPRTPPRDSGRPSRTSQPRDDGHTHRDRYRGVDHDAAAGARGLRPTGRVL